jgi:hypothetical protein
MIEIMNTEHIKCSPKFIEVAENIALETGEPFEDVLVQLLDDASFNEDRDIRSLRTGANSVCV